tara:strand:+ start:26675 stop:27178 length:504 start_codon:yes stop_codon:yes gene_type:complete
MSEEKTIEPDVKQETDTQVENNVPISRLNEVISERNQLRDSLESFKTKEEEERRAKLREEEKWQELNTDLAGEIESYKPYKERWEAMDARLREGALAQLPESKREKFANVETEVLLSIIEEFTEKEKVNPPDNKGTIPVKAGTDWVDMPDDERRRNWGTVLQSYMKR